MAEDSMATMWKGTLVSSLLSTLRYESRCRLDHGPGIKPMKYVSICDKADTIKNSSNVWLMYYIYCFLLKELFKAGWKVVHLV